MGKDGFEQQLIDLGVRVKELRLAAGLSQEALALAAEIDRTYVSQIERGVANPSLKILYQISQLLGAKLEIIYKK